MKMFRVSILAGHMALAFLTSPDVARAQNDRNCAWPIEISPEGFGNVVLPESFARDFIIPFDKQYETMTIKGTIQTSGISHSSFIKIGLQAISWAIFTMPKSPSIPAA